MTAAVWTTDAATLSHSCMRKQIVITALSAGLLVGACAGGAERGPDPQILIGAVSRLQCERAVWYRIGLHDGDAGL